MSTNPGEALEKKGKMNTEVFFLNKVKGDKNRGGRRHIARLDLNYFKRLISTNLGEAIEKGRKLTENGLR